MTDISQVFAGPAEEFEPVRLLEVELGEPIPCVPAVDPASGRRDRHALVLVRLHTRPLGVVRLDVSDEGLSAEEHARSIWACLQTEILQHLWEDRLPGVASVPAGGITRDTLPACLQARAQALADAPLVSVVVPTHDRPEHIGTCLAALLRLEYPRYEIIIVDNAPSTEATAQIVQEAAARWPNVRYVREDRPGASWARNRGLLEARGELIAFTDDDVVVDRYWLAETAKAFTLAQDVGCVTGNVLPQALETPAQAWFEERGGFSRGFTRAIYDMERRRSARPLFPYSAMMFGSGNSMAFRASVLREIGGFDPALDPASPARGGEDLAAFFEVLVHGHILVYEPAAFVRHLHRRDYDGLQKQMHAWGLGFVAYLVRSLLNHPELLPDFALRVPYGVAVLLRGRIPYSPDRVQKLSHAFPAGPTHALWRAEKLGYSKGVPAYLQSLRHVERIRRRFGPLPVVPAPAARPARMPAPAALPPPPTGAVAQSKSQE